MVVLIVGIGAFLLAPKELVELAVDVLLDLLGHGRKLPEALAGHALLAYADGVIPQPAEPAERAEDYRRQNDQSLVHLLSP